MSSNNLMKGSMVRDVLLVVAVIFTLHCLVAGASISGKVQDQIDRSHISGALVVLVKEGDPQFQRSTLTNEDGYFRFVDVGYGIYNIEVVKDGYFKNILFDLEVEKDINYSITIKLLKNEKGEPGEYCFLLGSIEVRAATKDIIPEELSTTRKITSGEIEHMQASSLGDVLFLVPGIEKSRTPGLSRPTKVGIRSVVVGSGDVDAIESFGTTIIVDGNELTNDANAKWRGEMGTSGIDLRGIPADNIKSVEVITGIPSVEYGNFANGIIKVETKSGYITPKLKIKINPDTKTASFSSGFKFAKAVLDYHINYGYSERDLRKEGDEFHRIYLSSNYSRKYFDDKLNIKLNGKYTKLIDNEEPTDIYKMKNYNQGYRASGNLMFDYVKDRDNVLSGFINLDLNRKKYYRERWVAEQIVYNDSIYPGYIGKLQEIGKEWQLTMKFKKERCIRLSEFTHRLLSGFEFDYQRNTGPGLIIDSVFNYYGAYSERRSYSFKEFEPLSRYTAYIEDNITGRVAGKKFELMAGLRYDVFNPGALSLSRGLFEDKHGEFLSPRFNFRLFVTDGFRIRFGAGRSVKSISLAYIYKPPAYFKYQKDTTVVEEVQIQRNPNLKAYSVDKAEVSLDWKLKDLVGFSLTGYFTSSDNRPAGQNYPWGYEQNPDTITSKSYSIYKNLGWIRSSGVELTMRTKRVGGFQYNLNITYRFSKTGRKGLTYDSSPDTSWEEIWYKPPVSWREKVIIDHSLTYVSNRLGVWITFDVQHIPLEHKKTVYRSNSTYLEVDGIPRLFYQGMSYPYYWENFVYSYTPHWIFNFRITKSISVNTEMSIYINNVFDDRGIYREPYQGYVYELNPPIYYGLEISTQW